MVPQSFTGTLSVMPHSFTRALSAVPQSFARSVLLHASSPAPGQSSTGLAVGSLGLCSRLGIISHFITCWYVVFCEDSSIGQSRWSVMSLDDGIFGC